MAEEDGSLNFSTNMPLLAEVVSSAVSDITRDLERGASAIDNVDLGAGLVAKFERSMQQLRDVGARQAQALQRELTESASSGTAPTRNLQQISTGEIENGAKAFRDVFSAIPESVRAAQPQIEAAYRQGLKQYLDIIQETNRATQQSLRQLERENGVSVRPYLGARPVEAVSQQVQEQTRAPLPAPATPEELLARLQPGAGAPPPPPPRPPATAVAPEPEPEPGRPAMPTSAQGVQDLRRDLLEQLRREREKAPATPLEIDSGLALPSADAANRQALADQARGLFEGARRIGTSPSAAFYLPDHGFAYANEDGGLDPVEEQYKATQLERQRQALNESDRQKAVRTGNYTVEDPVTKQRLEIEQIRQLQAKVNADRKLDAAELKAHLGESLKAAYPEDEERNAKRVSQARDAGGVSRESRGLVELQDSGAVLKQTVEGYRRLLPGTDELRRAQEVLATDLRKLSDAERGAYLATKLQTGEARTVAGYIQSGDKFYRPNLGAGTASELSDLEQPIARQRAAEYDSTVSRRTADAHGEPTGFFSGLAAGGTSKGYSGNGASGLQQTLTNLGETSGILLKYSASGVAIGLVTKALSGLVSDTAEYQSKVVELNEYLTNLNESLGSTSHATIDLNQSQANGLSVGLSSADSVAVGTEAVQAFGDEVRHGANANDIYQESLKQVGTAALLTGQSLALAQSNLQAATSGFQLGSGGQATINDALVNAQRNFGGDRGNILTAVASSAQIADEVGLSPDQLANISALVQSRTGATGAQTSSLLERLSARATTPDFQSALQQSGTANSGNLLQELGGLSKHYLELSGVSQQTFLKQVAGGRSLQGLLLPILREYSALVEKTGDDNNKAGSAEEARLKTLNTTAGFLKELTADGKSALTALGDSGLLAPLQLALGTIEPLLRLVANSLRVIDDAVPGAARGIGGFAVDYALAAVAISKFQQARARNAKSVGTTVPTAEGEAAGVVSTARDGAAVKVRTELVAVTDDLTVAEGAETRAAGVNAAVREAGIVADKEAASAKRSLLSTLLNPLGRSGKAGAEAKALAEGEKVEQTAVKGGLLASVGEAGLAGPIGVGVAAVGVAAVTTADGFIKLHEALGKSDTAIGKISGNTVPELQASIERLAAAKVDVNAASSGLIGSVVNFFAGNPAKNQRKALQAQIDEQKAQEDVLNKQDLNAHPQQAFSDLSDSSAISTGVARLRAAGQSNTQILAQLTVALDRMTGSAAAAAQRIAPGSLALPDGGANLAQGALDALRKGKIKLSPDEQAALLDDPGLLKSRFISSDAQLGSSSTYRTKQYSKAKSVTEVTGTILTPQEQDALRSKTVQTLARLGKNTNGAVLSPQDMDVLATEQAKAIVPPDQLKSLGPAYKAFLLKQLQDDAKKALSGSDFSVSSFVAGLDAVVTAGQGATSDATARGAGADELFGIAKGNLKGLEHQAATLPKDTSAADIGTLQQDLSAAKRETFDAFETKVKATAEQAKLALGNSPTDQAKARAIDAQTASILTYAEHIDPSLLPDSITSLTNAQSTLASLAGKQSAAVLAAAKANALATATAADQLAKQNLADAQAIAALAHPRDGSSGDGLAILGVHGPNEFGVKTAQDTADAADKYLKSVQASNGVTGQANNPGALAGIAALKKGSDITKTTLEPTAEQLSAALQLDAADSRDTVATARATEAVAKAEADNALTTRNVNNDAASTKDYYDKLKAYHEAHLATLKAQTDYLNTTQADSVDSRDITGAAAQALTNAIREQKAALPGTSGAADASAKVKKAQLDFTTAVRARDKAIADASTDPVVVDTADLKAAIAALQADLKNQAQFGVDLATVHSLQDKLGQAVRDAAKTTYLLGHDSSNPLVQAQADTAEAAKKLKDDTALKRDATTLNNDKLNLRTKQQNQESVGFNQELANQQTKEQLGQITHAAYLQYLENEHNRLQAIKAKTYTQQQELNQVDQAIKAANNTLQGQFNLGDIHIPTPYQVRRALTAATASASVGAASSTTVNNVSINGADLASVISYINTILGRGTATVATTGRKAA